MATDRWLVGSLFVGGCLSAAVYVVFCFPLLISGVARSLLPPSSSVSAWLQWDNETLRTTLRPLDACGPYGLCGARDLLTLVIFSVLGFMTLWSYIQAISVDPGHVPLALHQASPKSSGLSLKLFGSLHTCHMCSIYKPPRTHHCSRCQRCVLKYDHHCPWIGQCVGFFNYKLYLLFVLYTHMFTVFVTLTLGGSVVRYILTTSKAPSAMTSILNLLEKVPIGSTAAAYRVATVPVMCAYLMALVFQFLTLYLLPLHWRYLRHNLTTVEVVIRGKLSEEERAHWANPYDLGVEENIAAVFGDGSWSAESRHRLLDDPAECGEPNSSLIASTKKWVRRLLPLEPYPPQPLPLLNQPSMGMDMNATKGTYGATEHSKPPHHPHSRYHIRAMLTDDRMIGLLFPVDSQRLLHSHA